MLLSLQRRFDKLDGQSDFEMPFDVTFGIPLIYIHLGSGGTKEYVQCKNHTPGLSATNRIVADPMDGIPTTSLRTGFACPSTMGGFSVGSEEV